MKEPWLKPKTPKDWSFSIVLVIIVAVGLVALWLVTRG